MKDRNKLSFKYNYLPISKDIPDFVRLNLHPRFKLRPYQIEALSRFIHYLKEYPQRQQPVHLLFNMATGSGKTLLMAANILYLYKQGYSFFLFFVNNTNIIEKTRDNFLNPGSPKYLFNERIVFDGNEVFIKEVENFDAANSEDINIIFTTIQSLHSQLTILFRENAITFEDFKDKKIVLISDEAHHINALTKNKTKTENEITRSWEETVTKILNSNKDNILLEYTATIGLDNPAIYEKYKDKIIFEYDLRQFRQDGYSKEVKVLQADLDNWERMLQAVILSQYRMKIAELYGIRLKPVILFKSKSIRQSRDNYELFVERMNKVCYEEILHIKQKATNTVMEKVFRYFEDVQIDIENLIRELKQDFSQEKCLLLDSQNIDPEKQILLNTLEADKNPIRAIFAVRMLDEGWDVLNLFDIVRLYDTRDGHWSKDGNYIPGTTTIAERQLIGRGARYYPFSYDNLDIFKRKFDGEPDNPLRIIEELYYHSKYNPQYINEITAALRNFGIIPDTKEETRKRRGILKNKIQKTIKKQINSPNDLILFQQPFKYYHGNAQKEQAIFSSSAENNHYERHNKLCELKIFGQNVIRKAMAKLDFYRFDNLKRLFPALRSTAEFIGYLEAIKVEIIGNAQQLKPQSLSADEKLKICVSVLSQLQKEILRHQDFS